MERDAYPSESIWDELVRNSLWHKQRAEVRQAVTAWDADLIPDVAPPAEFDDSFKQYIRNLDAATALARLTIKRPIPATLRSGDGNKFRCPWETHEDRRPDAWLNTTNNTWFCGPCWSGGDWIDLAAAARGFTYPGQKLRDTGRFSELMRQLEAEFGWIAPRAVVYVEAEEEAPEAPAAKKSRWNLDA